MKLSLARARWRWAFFALILSVAASFSFEAGKVWLAYYRAHSSNPEAWLRAAELEPGNAQYWHRLGLFEEWDFERGDLGRAVSYYERAAQANPHSDVYWMDLASASETLGEMSRAQKAFERARATYPASSEVAWRYGNFLLRQQEYSQAFAEFRRALAGDPRLTSTAISQCWKASHSVHGILNEVLPAQSSFYFSALDYFASQGEADAALAVWDQLLRLKQRFEMPQVVPLINELVRQDRLADALRVWRGALWATGWPQDAGAGSSLVFNGGLEHGVVNGGFDWMQPVIRGASFALDTTVVHSGSRSLRITFDGSANLDFSNVLQWVAVEPRRRYRFAAYLRTEGISTDSGVRFMISDFRRPAALQILPPGLVGSHPWSRVEQEFVTGPDTHLLVITLRRIPSWKFDNHLRGTVWVDDVSLVPMAEETKESRR